MEAKFLTDLVVKEIDDGTWEVVQPLRYQSECLNKTIEVPAGFLTDFASVPRVPFAYWLTGDSAHEAAVVHDYLYQTHIESKEQADSTFLEASKVTGIPAWRRWIMYMAVKACGKSSYDSGPSRIKILADVKAAQ